MLKSFNKLTEDEMKTLCHSLNLNKSDQLIYFLTPTEKEKALELENVLDDLMFATNEFQADRVTSYTVYPTISFLKEKMIANMNKYKHTRNLRKEIVKSICKILSQLLYNDIFRFATFLDPRFSHESFP